MTEKKIKTNKIEREYVIPLRRRYQHVARYKKTPKAVKTIKEFLVRHMKIYERDLRKIKIDKYLNEYLWFRGIKNPPHKVKVKVIKEGDIVKVELLNLPDKLKFKKAREEKRELKAKKALEKTKSSMQKAKESLQKSKSEESDKDTKEKTEEKEEKKQEEKEKKSAVIEANQKQQKQQSKAQKHMTNPKSSKTLHREQKITNK